MHCITMHCIVLPKQDFYIVCKASRFGNTSASKAENKNKY